MATMLRMFWSRDGTPEMAGRRGKGSLMSPVTPELARDPNTLCEYT